MRNIRLCVFVLATFASMCALYGAPPARPNFSGTWSMDESRSESAHQDVPMGPVTVVIRQTRSEVSIETTRTENGQPGAFHEVITYKLDGAESTSNGSAGTPVVAKAHWDGTKLVTETARNVQDSTVTTVYVFSLNPGGREMIIDKSLTVQHGYQFQGAKTTGRGKDTFRKTAD